MPSLEQHCQSCKLKYDEEGREIHIWMDEACKVLGGGHRIIRHNKDTLRNAAELFINKYSSNMIENIVLDHLILDAEETKTKRKGRYLLIFEKKEWTHGKHYRKIEIKEYLNIDCEIDIAVQTGEHLASERGWDLMKVTEQPNIFDAPIVETSIEIPIKIKSNNILDIIQYTKSCKENILMDIINEHGTLVENDWINYACDKGIDKVDAKKTIFKLYHSHQIIQITFTPPTYQSSQNPNIYK